MNPIEFYNAHHAVCTAVLMALVHFAHLTWPRLKRTIFFFQANGGVDGQFSQFWYGRPDPAGLAAQAAWIKQIHAAGPEAGAPAGQAPGVPISTSTTGEAPVPLNKSNE